MHYHLVSVSAHRVTIANARIETWPEALDKYTAITNGLFGHLFDQGELTIENASQAMDGGDGKGSLAGSYDLSIALLTCKEECEWASPTWN